jgi:protein phosphatase
MLLGQSDKTAREEVGDGEDRHVPAAITDTGCERELNEDRYAVVESPSGLAWIVCDGMGGATGGELAAQLAIDAIRRDLENLPPRPGGEALRDAILEANRIIVLRRQNQAFAQMGTTIVAAMFDGPELAVAHVGDSRAYLIREGAIQQLTTDHTFVQDLVERGQIKVEEALSHPQAHILTRAIGSEPALEVDLNRYWIWDPEPGERPDVLVLCTDGLYSQVSEIEVAALVSEESPQRACVRMVELAKARGGFDNISVAVVPLGGQLKNEPPPGYDPQRALERKLPKAKGRPVGRSLVRPLLIVSVLSILAAALTVVGVLTFGFGQ